MFYRITKPYYNYDKTCNAATKWAVSCPRMPVNHRIFVNSQGSLF